MEITTLPDTFAALGSPVRLAIVERLLRDGELAAGDLAAEGGVSAPAMSHHFKVLREAGIVTQRVDAQRRFGLAESGDRRMSLDPARLLGPEPRQAGRGHRAGAKADQRIADRAPLSDRARELFDYLTQPGNVVKWWGPEGATVVDAELDLAKVGPWRLVRSEGAGRHRRACGRRAW